ncbi:PIN domain-containing protein [Microvirga thermotolerans]|nr:PIN domain-containing protein [Microvirga thermotolerans]
MPAVFFVDTNFFIQGADPNAMPWREVTDADEILLIISRPVQEELDRQKGEGRGRRGRRARAASSLMGELLDTPDLSKVIRQKNPRIVIQLDDLDPDVRAGASDDDRIVQAAISYAASHPGVDVRLLSADTGPCLSARVRKFPHHRLNGAWLAPPEPDHADREVEELKRRVSALEEDEPKFEVGLTNRNGAAVDVAIVEVTSFRNLTAEEVDALSSQVASMFPKATDFRTKEPNAGYDLLMDRLSRGTWVAPSEDDIRQYHQQYDEWLAGIRKTLKEMLSHESDKANRQIHFLALRNSGGAYAHEVVVELSLSPGLMFHPDLEDDEEREAPTIKPPPVAPRGRFRSFLTDLGMADRLMHHGFSHDLANLIPNIRPRDRHAFHLETDFEVPCAKLEYRCDSFRHKVDGPKFALDIRPAKDADVKGGRLMVRVASRTTDPEELSFPIKIHRREGDSLALVRQCIERSSRA